MLMLVPSVSVEAEAKWTVRMTKDKLTDKPIGRAYATAPHAGLYGKDGVLVIRCDSGTLDVWIDAARVVDDEAHLQIRIDREPAGSIEVVRADDNTSYFVSRDQPMFNELLVALTTRSRLIVRIIDYQSHSHDYEFAIAGGERSISLALKYGNCDTPAERVARSKKEKEEAEGRNSRTMAQRLLSCIQGCLPGYSRESDPRTRCERECKGDLGISTSSIAR